MTVPWFTDPEVLRLVVYFIFVIAVGFSRTKVVPLGYVLLAQYAINIEQVIGYTFVMVLGILFTGIGANDDEK